MSVLRERTLAAQSETGLLNPTVTPSPTATEVLMELPPSPEAVIAEPLSTPSPTALPPLAAQSSGVDVRLVVERSAWIQVLVDGQESFRGRVTPGQLLEYVGQEVVEVTTGNAAGFRVFYNGQDQGTLGALGEVVIRLWTTEGVLTPTPTQTHTPTVTPRRHHYAPLDPHPPDHAGRLVGGQASLSSGFPGLCQEHGRLRVHGLPAGPGRLRCPVDPRRAEVLIVNTCGFIGPAREESLQVLARAGGRKTAGPASDRRRLPEPALRR